MNPEILIAALGNVPDQATDSYKYATFQRTLPLIESICCWQFVETIIQCFWSDDYKYAALQHILPLIGSICWQHVTPIIRCFRSNNNKTKAIKFMLPWITTTKGPLVVSDSSSSCILELTMSEAELCASPIVSSASLGDINKNLEDSVCTYLPEILGNFECDEQNREEVERCDQCKMEILDLLSKFIDLTDRQVFTKPLLAKIIECIHVTNNKFDAWVHLSKWFN